MFVPRTCILSVSKYANTEASKKQAVFRKRKPAHTSARVMRDRPHIKGRSWSCRARIIRTTLKLQNNNNKSPLQILPKGSLPKYLRNKERNGKIWNPSCCDRDGASCADHRRTTAPFPRQMHVQQQMVAVQLQRGRSCRVPLPRPRVLIHRLSSGSRSEVSVRSTVYSVQCIYSVQYCILTHSSRLTRKYCLAIV